MKNLLKLHVGCGKRFIPGFVHVDQVSFPHVDYVQDIRRLENFKDGASKESRASSRGRNACPTILQGTLGILRALALGLSEARR